MLFQIVLEKKYSGKERLKQNMKGVNMVSLKEAKPVPATSYTKCGTILQMSDITGWMSRRLAKLCSAL